MSADLIKQAQKKLDRAENILNSNYALDKDIEKARVLCVQAETLLAVAKADPCDVQGHTWVYCVDHRPGHTDCALTRGRCARCGKMPPP